MELTWNQLREQTETCRISVSRPVLLPGDGEELSLQAEKFNRFSDMLAAHIAGSAGNASSLRAEGSGWLRNQRYLSVCFYILRFENGSLSGFSCVSHNRDLKNGIILRLRDIITKEGMQKAALFGKKFHGCYFDEKGLHLYICNFNKEQAKHCRVSQYPSFLQEYIIENSFFAI